MLAPSVILSMPLAAADAEQALPEVRVQSSKDTSSYQPLTGTTGTKLEVPLRDVPQSIDVVPHQVIEDRGALSVEQALRNVPGIGLSHGDGQRDQVTIRGFSAIGDQYVDGFRDDALYFRDLSNVERIEVLKGPGSVLYGRGSSGGLINRVTKKPNANPVNELTLRYGSFDLRRAEIDVGTTGMDKRLQLRLTGALEDSGSYRSQQFLEREAVAPSIAFDVSRDTRLMLQADYLSDRRVTDFGVPAINGRPVAVDSSTYYGSANARRDDYSQSTVYSTTATFTHRFDDAWSFRNITRYYDYDLDRNNTLPGRLRTVGGTTVVDLNRGKVRRQEDGLFNQSELVQKTSLGGMSHEILYGIELGRQKKDQRFFNVNNIATVSLYDPVLPDLGPFPANVAPGTDNVGTITTQGFYVQDLVTLARQWKALIGVRYDVFGQKVQERRAGQADQSRTDREWSPRAGLVWQPADWQSYYVSASRSFQPSAETFNLAANNAQLEPEQTTNYEVGSKLDVFGGQATFTTALFTTTRTNIKTTDPSNPSQLIPVGEQRTNGLELTLAGKLAERWDIVAWYAYLDGRITKSTATGPGIPVLTPGEPLQGKRPSLTPEHSAQVWVKYAFDASWSAGAGVNYVGDMYAAPDNVVTLPAYTLLDVGLFYKSKHFDAALNVNNLLDKDYYVSAHGASNILNLPGSPRAVIATVKFKL